MNDGLSTFALILSIFALVVVVLNFIAELIA